MLWEKVIKSCSLGMIVFAVLMLITIFLFIPIFESKYPLPSPPPYRLPSLTGFQEEEPYYLTVITLLISLGIAGFVAGWLSPDSNHGMFSAFIIGILGPLITLPITSSAFPFLTCPLFALGVPIALVGYTASTIRRSNSIQKLIKFIRQELLI